MITVTKIFEFEAAHHLPNYEGDCRNMHGHTYKLEVTVTGVVSMGSGMIVDFKELKEFVQHRVLGTLDHSLLNDFVGNPTAERLVAFIQGRLSQGMESLVRCELVKIRLWETSNSYCEWVK